MAPACDHSPAWLGRVASQYSPFERKRRDTRASAFLLARTTDGSGISRSKSGLSSMSVSLAGGLEALDAESRALEHWPLSMEELASPLESEAATLPDSMSLVSSILVSVSSSSSDSLSSISSSSSSSSSTSGCWRMNLS